MNQAIDVALEPQEYISEIGPKKGSTSITIEVDAHRKLMLIAEAAYAHLYQNAPVSDLRKACTEYAVFCGVIPKGEMEAVEQMRRRKKQASISPDLVELNAAMQRKESPRRIRERCEQIVCTYTESQRKGKKAATTAETKLSLVQAGHSLPLESHSVIVFLPDVPRREHPECTAHMEKKKNGIPTWYFHNPIFGKRQVSKTDWWTYYPGIPTALRRGK